MGVRGSAHLMTSSHSTRLWGHTCINQNISASCARHNWRGRRIPSATPHVSSLLRSFYADVCSTAITPRFLCLTTLTCKPECPPTARAPPTVHPRMHCCGALCGVVRCGAVVVAGADPVSQLDVKHRVPDCIPTAPFVCVGVPDHLRGNQRCCILGVKVRCMLGRDNCNLFCADRLRWRWREMKGGREGGRGKKGEGVRVYKI